MQSSENMNGLPAEWIERIFAIMAYTYGNRFIDMWRDQDMDGVKLHWAEKLAGFRYNPAAIKSALDSLDEQSYPPSLSTFIQMARNAAKNTRHDPTAMLDYKPTSKAEAMERIAELKTKFGLKGIGHEAL